MYSFEIEQYINDRNHELNRDEVTFITDIEQHNQISRIKYEDNLFHIWTKDDYHFWFSVKQKVLVK
jgi:hypothetical protein